MKMTPGVILVTMVITMVLTCIRIQALSKDLVTIKRFLA